MEVYLGEIRLFAFDYAPQGWMPCDGTILPINDNEVLFTLLGTTYGGDGVTTFALPDMRGRIPVGVGMGTGLNKEWKLGEKFGEEFVTLDVSNLPKHSHELYGTTSQGNTNQPEKSLLASAPLGDFVYTLTDYFDTYMNSESTTSVGAAKPIDNMMSTMALNYCIAVKGVHPLSGEDITAEPFVGEVKIFANNFVPDGFYPCNGTFLEINRDDNIPLFSVIGNKFGGFANVSFKLPYLEDAAISHRDTLHSSRQKFGEITGYDIIQLTEDNIPPHNHDICISKRKGMTSEFSAEVFPAKGHKKDGTRTIPLNIYGDVPSNSNMSPIMLTNTGGHNADYFNEQPFISLIYCICKDGAYPTKEY